MSGFPDNLFAGARFAVVGLGRNGLPAARALAAMGADVIAWDDQAPARDSAAEPGITVADPREISGALDALVLSPGIPHTLPKPHPIAAWARESGLPILSDAELLFVAARRAGSPARFAGITGTNGKSTTTALLAHIIRESGRRAEAGGNLGPAALALPFLDGPGDVYVLEMSSYMLERIATLRFDTAAMLNLSPDHIDRHGDMDGYVAAKRAIFAAQTEGDTAVIGMDDPASRSLAAESRPAHTLRISGETVADVGVANGNLVDSTGPIIALADMKALPGSHNAQNAAAATAMALHLGIARADIARGLASFDGLAHRQERIAAPGELSWINDSKATNADSTARALACHPRVIWIAGGIAKQGGIEALAPFFPRVAHALLIGRDAAELQATLRVHGVSHEIAGTLDAAVPLARDAAHAYGAKIVLLSPSCASFDQFSGFEARGERFRELVLALPEQGGA